MDSLAYARQRSAELFSAIQEKEQSILAKLQEGVGLSSVAAMEVELAALVSEADDAATVLQYYENLGEIQRKGDVFKMVFQMDRALVGAVGPADDCGQIEGGVIPKCTQHNNNSSNTPRSQDADYSSSAAKETTESLRCETEDDALLSSVSTRWSAECNARAVSGVVITTSSVAFIVLEGNDEPSVRAAASELMCQTPRVLIASSFMLLNTGRVHAREHDVGLKVRYVEDRTMDAILSKCREVVALGVRFAPRHASEMAMRGGNPLLEVRMTQKGIPLLLVTLAYRHGVVHSPAVYNQLALCIEAIVRPHGGRVIESFGEHMIIGFERKGKWPSNQVLEVACQLLQQQSSALAMPSSSLYSSGPSSSFSLSPSGPHSSEETAIKVPMAPSDLHVVVHMGDVTFVNQKHCVAYGEGLKQVKALAYVAEASQRPLVISPVALLHASKAMFRTIPFSHNTVGYYTFPGLELTRSVHLPEPFKIEAPTGMKVDDGLRGTRSSAAKMNSDKEPKANTVRLVHCTKEDLLYGSAAAMPITGEDNQVEEYKAFFRRLDPRRNGWITKVALRSFLLSNEAFVVFPHDAPRIDGWIAEAQSLGPERISLDEFLFLCVRMKQL